MVRSIPVSQSNGVPFFQRMTQDPHPNMRPHMLTDILRLGPVRSPFPPVIFHYECLCNRILPAGAGCGITGKNGHGNLRFCKAKGYGKPENTSYVDGLLTHRISYPNCYFLPSESFLRRHGNRTIGGLHLFHSVSHDLHFMIILQISFHLLFPPLTDSP